MDHSTEDKEKMHTKSNVKSMDYVASLITKDSSFVPNIPYSPLYLALFNHVSTDFDSSKYNSEEVLKIKMFVNKKCNQISTDYSHSKHIVEEIAMHKNNPLFIEIFIRKLLDQGRVQVSGHFESYKPLSYILYRIDSIPTLDIFIKLLIGKKGSESELKGMYAIYFGYLNIKEDVDSSWIWVSSVLNVTPNEYSGYILEAFLYICSTMLLEKIPGPYKGILNYIKKFYVAEINNKPVETRILNIVNSYLG